MHEVLEQGVELKANWSQDCGKDISAIANKPDRTGGWIVIGCSDGGGAILGNTLTWLRETEQKVSNHINHYLTPDFTVVNIKGEIVADTHVLLVEISSPNEVVRWNEITLR